MNGVTDFLEIGSEDLIRPTRVEVDLNTLSRNFKGIKDFTAPAKIMPVLKANAYGHGIVRVAQLMQDLGADYLGVAVLEEGILLRKKGINIPILVMGGIWGNQIPQFIKYDLTITASSIGKLKQIEEISAQMKKRAKVHLKIDTGMERIGVHYYSAELFLKESLNCRHVDIEGIYSHFANSDGGTPEYTRLQFDRFKEALSFYEKNSLPAPIRHISNSGGILQLPEANLDMVRPGILLYGVYPSKESAKRINVDPALTWKSMVVYFKVIKPNHPVGYGSIWQSDREIRAVTVPVGYGDGYFRNMSGKAEVIIRGKRYPVIGRISMDQIVVNIENDSAYNGDEVILCGADERASITVEELAEWAGTIPYEVLTSINTRVPRVYYP